MDNRYAEKNNEVRSRKTLNELFPKLFMIYSYSHNKFKFTNFNDKNKVYCMLMKNILKSFGTMILS